ncbi:uncharacterized protein LOC126213158 isoform X1 [Schistocerca nitens]|uniref:uncharacterized protein LOC126213158 isoform X1 n=1 Tax=Schistocerca nitens TaxID=7011 RepID=UPI0021173A85|nr:uncharacterized protein LOC126213158 isoform X1 [Schistocerca nitens]
MHSECRTFTTYISIVMIYKTVVLDNLKTISVKEEKTEEMCVEPGTMKHITNPVPHLSYRIVQPNVLCHHAVFFGMVTKVLTEKKITRRS